MGYKASAEQFDPRMLLELTQRAEAAGLDSVAFSDHFQPWRHSTGHAPNSLVLLGAAGAVTTRVRLATSVLTPTLRYHPSIVAQSFATLGCIYPGRVILGVGTGEAMNETPATAAAWPSPKERRLRLAESIRLIRLLWSEERVTFEGEYYRTNRATIYDRPEEPVPIYVASSGPLAAKLAGRAGDGLICTSGKGDDLYRELLKNVREGAEQAGRDYGTIARMIEVKVSYDRDHEFAQDACRWWAALALSAEEKSGIEDPLELERLADANAEHAHSRFIVSSDPEECAERIWWYVDAGFDHLVFHAPGFDQQRFLEQFATDVLPLLRQRAGEPADTEPGRRAGVDVGKVTSAAQQTLIKVWFRSGKGDEWSAIGAGNDLEEAIAFARASCPDGPDWTVVRWNDLYGE